MIAENACLQDAAEPFHFPETITSVSYSLRKAYINHLWDYEQVRALAQRTMRFGSTANVLVKRMLKYYRISECSAQSFVCQSTLLCANCPSEGAHFSCSWPLGIGVICCCFTALVYMPWLPVHGRLIDARHDVLHLQSAKHCTSYYNE